MVIDDRLCVAVLANSSWNIFNFRKTLIQFLSDQNYRVLVLAPEDEYTDSIISWKGIEYIPIKQLNAKSVNPIKDLFLVIEYYKILKNYKPDLILPHTIKPNMYSSLVARWLKIPAISSLTGLGSIFIQDTFVNILIRKCYQWALSKNKFILFHNKIDRNDWCQKSLFPISKTDSMPGSGIDLDLFKPKSAPIISNEFIFLYLGRLHPDKGIREFLYASKIFAQTHLNVSFWIAGDLLEADYKEGYEKIVQLLNSIPRLRYLGKQTEITALLEQVQIVVLPSYREGMSRALMEAMAMSKPVIATNVAGINELIADEVEGLLIPPGEVIALTQAMDRMMQMPEGKLHAMGAAGRLKIETYYSVQKVYAAYSEFFEKVFQSNKIN